MRTILYAHMCDGTGVSENVRYWVGLRVSAASEKYEQSILCLWELFPLEKYHSIPIYEIELCLNKGSGVLTSITNIKKVRYWTWGDDSESFHPRRLTRQFNLLFFRIKCMREIQDWIYVYNCVTRTRLTSHSDNLWY